MSRRRFSHQIYDSINVTPLIDTLFFLLIIFMVTAPLLEYTVEVSPPQMNADKMEPDPDSKIVNVKEDGTILFERRTVSADQLVSELSALAARDPKEPIYLRADGKLSYGKVMEVMKQIRHAGFSNVLLVMEEEQK
ncbi:MAG: biopolymer transporter ExbD [Lentisphaeria bacterium]|nr:biopolymer transporter ExbD [Lentisphaeria bacterium]